MNAQKRKKISISNKRNHQKMKLLRECNLEPGMTGFFCAYYDHYEDDCIREAYNVLSEFADNLYGPETKSFQTSDEKTSAAKKASENRREIESEIGDKANKEQEDIFTASKKVVASLKVESQNPDPSRRFQIIDTGVECVVFMKTILPDPLELVSTIVRSQLDETKKHEIEFLMRLLPIELICKAEMDDILVKMDPLLEKYFTQEPKTFAIVLNLHSHSNLKRHRVNNELFDAIVKKNPGNKLDLLYPELGVVVEVIHGVCLISIAPHYYTYKKYNMRDICRVPEPTIKESAHATQLLIATIKRKREEKESAKKVEPARDPKMNAEAEIASEDK